MVKGRGQHNLKKRGGVWYFDGYVNGRRTRKSLGTDSLAEAKAKRDAITGGQIDRLALQRKRDLPPAALWDAYVLRFKGRASSLEQKRVAWDQFLGVQHPRTIGAVTVHDCEAYMRHMVEKRGNAPQTANHQAKLLRILWNWAIKHEYFDGPNPWSKVEPFPVPKRKLRPGRDFLTREQRDAMLEAAKAHSTDIYLFCALTALAGMRTVEAGFARWDWFDFERGVIHIEADLAAGFQLKDNEDREVPISNPLRRIFEGQSQRGAYVILPDKNGGGKWRVRYEPKHAFETVAKAAGVPGVTPHKLRHTFASLLAMQGVSLYKIGEWLGHANPKTTKRYSHLIPDVDDAINAGEN